MKNFPFLKGTFNEKDYLSPSYISNKNPKYLEIDNMYYSSLIAVNYHREYESLILEKIINSNINVNISCFYEKQDNYKIIKDLTYYIGNVGAELKETNENRMDIDIAAFTYQDAKYIRKQIQIENEDIYFLYLYFTVFYETIPELEYSLNKLEGLLQGIGIQTRRAYFRQEQAFKSMLPFMNNLDDIKQIAKRNILTSGIISTYPFISSSIFDEKGILIGTNIYNNSLIFIDRFDSNKYKNANMCIFGTSGAGKSFFTKVMIIRYRLMNIEQYIIDPEREYLKLCNNLGGTIIKIGPNSKTFINVLDIREESIEEKMGYLATKINKLIGFFNMIFGDMNEEEKGILEENLIECYKLKNITFEDDSLYKETDKIKIKPVFKESKDMPILEDLYNVLKKDKRTQKMQIKLIPFIKGSLRFFNNYTNVEINNNLIIADVYDLGEENLKYGMYLFTELFWDKVKIKRNSKKIIYLDEAWRMIGITSNKHVANFLYKIFKTIRKYGGSAVAITQDISDLFSLENGVYGKSIINNSSIKCFFSLEEENITVLDKYIKITEKEKIEIKSLKRGECLNFVGEKHILTKVEVAEFEKEII